MNAQIEQRSDEWRKARVGLITGSRIAPVLGHSPWQSRKALLREMVAEANGVFANQDSPAMAWGREREAEALADFRLRHLDLDADLIEGGWLTMGDDLGYSPDARADDLLIEVKAPFSRRIPVEPPIHYIDQCQLGMLVCDLPRAALHVWTPDESRTFWLDADPAWREAALPRVADFMAEYRDAIAHPERWLAEERNDQAWLAAVGEYQLAQQAAEATKARLEAARQLLLELSANLPARGGGLRVEWLERAGNVNWQKLASDFHITKGQQDAYRSEGTRYARITADE